MTSLHDAWTTLRHGGNLLSPAGLDDLPAPDAIPWGLPDRLRTALVALDPEHPTATSLGSLLDTVLEDVCGLNDGWQKGSAIGATHAAKLLDGTVLKPRRIWAADAGEPLAVFTTSASRLGVGKGRRPVSQVVEYLRRQSIALGVLTNGVQWRLVWTDVDSIAWVEWEADRWLLGDQLAEELDVLRRVLSTQALERGVGGRCPLVSAIRDTRRGQARLSKELGERVRRSVETLLRSRASVLGAAWDEHGASDLYIAACHFVMRLVVTLFAEARELLPSDNPLYHQAYGLRGLLDQLDRLTPERRRSRHSAWPRLLALFRLLHQGSPHPAMALPAYGGDLFRPGDPNGDAVQRALALIEALPEPPVDEAVYHLLILLTRTTQKVREGSGWRTVAAPVDFTELTSEYIGILYEGLLDYELHRVGTHPIVFLNLGDQPALPLDRLESMDDKALKALVETATVRNQPASNGGEDDEAEAEDEEGEDEDLADPAESDAASVETQVGQDDSTQGNARWEARARVIAWGRRAAEIGGLVKKPKGKKIDSIALYQAQLHGAAERLVPTENIKLPGELYLVRWGGTRKGAGSFYTRPQLTQPTVRRTLDPLIYDEPLVDGSERAVRPPEALLALKVCDPAMGSGSFLVAALRVLTATVVESLHVHGRIQRINGRTTVDCELLPEADRSLPTEGFDERLEAIVRRTVVEHCLYGVDLDQLAVELARVALWVETLDRRLPFTFLDHKLRCGDALVGTWLDHFRDYPLLCFDRQSPDLKYRGVHHDADVWHNALLEKRAAAISEQVDLITGQIPLQTLTTSDDELKAAVERVRRLYRDLRSVPAGRPDERARIWRERIQTDVALTRVREAFDTWCALWFWPLDQLDAMPLPSQLPAPGEAAAAVVKALSDDKHFFHWELEFPDVFSEEDAGFDAIVGNPPWEIQKPNSKEFFSNHDPLYRAYGKQEALQVQKAIFTAYPTIETEWLAYSGDFKDRGNFVRNAAEPFGDVEDELVDRKTGKKKQKIRVMLIPRKTEDSRDHHKTWRLRRARYRGLSDHEHSFRHQGSADLNTYKMFIEQAYVLLRHGGQMGLLVPSGTYTDKGTGDLRKLLLRRCSWRWLYGFENRNKLFDIHRSFKFCVLIASKGGQTEAIQAAFMRHELEDWVAATGTLAYPAERVAAFSPKSLSVLEIRSQADLAVLTKLYANGVLLGDEGPNGWGIKYATEFHMTNDSKLFVNRDKAETLGFRPDEYGRWENSSGDVLLPVYEGRMIGQFDFSEKGWVSGTGRSAVWREIPWGNKQLEPQYLMRREDFINSGCAGDGRARAAFMDVTLATNRRTMIAALIPRFPAGNKVPTLANSASPAALVGALCSTTFDWQVRQRLGGVTLNYFIVEEAVLPHHREVVPAIETFALRLAAAGTPLLAEFREVASVGSDIHRTWAITPHERLRIRCMLDAIVALLYGLNRADFAWILRDCDHSASRLADRVFCRQLDPKGFWRVDNADDEELRQTVLSLAAFDDLTTAVAAAGGERPAGVQAFCSQNDGHGWMLPETVCVADLGLIRTVEEGHYETRALSPQPVRSRMGERFLDWQLAKTPEESWAECERHANAILEGLPASAATPHEPAAGIRGTQQFDLFDKPV